MENPLKHMKLCVSCPSPFMCRHIQPKKDPKNPKLDSSPREARRRAQRRRAGRGLESNLGFLGSFLGCRWRHIKGEGQEIHNFIGFNGISMFLWSFIKFSEKYFWPAPVYPTPVCQLLIPAWRSHSLAPRVGAPWAPRLSRGTKCFICFLLGFKSSFFQCCDLPVWTMPFSVLHFIYGCIFIMCS